MRPATRPRDVAELWKRYEPLGDRPWDRGHVARVHRRAGFQASPETIEADLEAGCDRTIDRLIAGQPTALDGRPVDEFETAMDALSAECAASGSLTRLQAAWIYRMILTPHPVRERMTRFWHGHFATSNAKVNNLKLMNRQIALFRAAGMGDFRTLLARVGEDPAMLLFLDSSTNRKAHPNENYAREVMELFSLGRGNYSEQDVREAARAFTGRFVQGDRFREVAAQHDPNSKRVLGVEGVLSGDAVVSILVDQPACAQFLARKLYRMFICDSHNPDDAALEPLSAELRGNRYDLTAALDFLFRSRLFHESSASNRRVRSPVEQVVGTIRALGILDPAPSPEGLAEACVRMGESLYAPPNVAGWPGGPAWINTASSIERANLMLNLVSTTNAQFGKRIEPAAFARKHGAGDRASAIRMFASFLIDEGLRPPLEQRLQARRTSSPDESDEAVRFDLALLLSSPESQLA